MNMINCDRCSIQFNDTCNESNKKKKYCYMCKLELNSIKNKTKIKPPKSKLSNSGKLKK